jgi:hypothetical protein
VDLLFQQIRKWIHCFCKEEFAKFPRHQDTNIGNTKYKKLEKRS